MNESANYVDIYTLPVREDRLEEYREQARIFGTVVVELGGLRYREFVLDDRAEGMETGEGFVMTAALVEFASKDARNEVMAAVMKDERVKGMADPTEGPAEMTQMTYGGFEVLLDA